MRFNLVETTMGTMIDEEPIGVWAAHLKPVEGELEWSEVPQRALAAFVGRRQFAVIRRVKNRHWEVSIPGFQWTITAGLRDLGIKYSAVKAFTTVAKARRAVEQVYQIRQNRS